MFYRGLFLVIVSGIGGHALYLFDSADLVAGIGTQIAVMGFESESLRNGDVVPRGSAFDSHLFVHNWSLAVEVHYYLLWGLAVWFLANIQTAGQLGSIFCCLCWFAYQLLSSITYVLLDSVFRSFISRPGIYLTFLCWQYP